MKFEPNDLLFYLLMVPLIALIWFLSGYIIYMMARF